MSSSPLFALVACSAQFTRQIHHSFVTQCDNQDANRRQVGCPCGPGFTVGWTNPSLRVSLSPALFRLEALVMHTSPAPMHSSPHLRLSPCPTRFFHPVKDERCANCVRSRSAMSRLPALSRPRRPSSLRSTLPRLPSPVPSSRAPLPPPTSTPFPRSLSSRLSRPTLRFLLLSLLSPPRFLLSALFCRLPVSELVRIWPWSLRSRPSIDNSLT